MASLNGLKRGDNQNIAPAFCEFYHPPSIDKVKQITPNSRNTHNAVTCKRATVHVTASEYIDYFNKFTIELKSTACTLTGSG